MKILGTGAAQLNIYFQIGSYRTIIFDFGVDVSAWTFEFVIRKNKGDRVKTLSLTLGSGLSFPVYVSDQVQATFSTTGTAIEEGEYYYELRRTDTALPLLNGLAYFTYDALDGTEADDTLGLTVSAQTITLTVSNALTQTLYTRVYSTTTLTTLTPNVDTYDLLALTAQASALTIAAPTGTATNGNMFVIRIKDNGTARAITFASIYRAIGITLPTTTVISKTVYITVIYNAADTKFDVVGLGQEV